MATTNVTLKLAPHELQIVRDALQVYMSEMAALDRVGTVLSAPVPVYGDDAFACANEAKALLAEIGLRPLTEESEHLQVRMFHLGQKGQGETGGDAHSTDEMR